MTVAVSNANRIKAAVRTLCADYAKATFAGTELALTIGDTSSKTVWALLAELAGVEYPTAATRRTVLAWLHTITTPEGPAA